MPVDPPMGPKEGLSDRLVDYQIIRCDGQVPISVSNHEDVAANSRLMVSLDDSSSRVALETHWSLSTDSPTSSVSSEDNATSISL